MSEQRPLLMATEADATLHLAKALDADFSPLPAAGEPERFEAWRSEAMAGEPREAIVIAAWLDAPSEAELMDVDTTAWRRRFELPYLLWNFALGAAGRRVTDGGALVGVVQAPAALDAPGWTPELAIADGVFSLIRSLAAAEGPRGVRANLVNTPIGLVEGELIAPAPPLEGFPGTIERHVAGAVRTLLSPDAIGLTGRVLTADGGRSL
jgi:NAD(P)-dependent dehydrogenase (short-subunit alcohol dehydrogenase family)